jgi:hypothetical protein
MKYLGHIKRHKVLEKRIMEGYIPERRKRGDQKGDGFRISQMELQISTSDLCECGLQ